MHLFHRGEICFHLKPDRREGAAPLLLYMISDAEKFAFLIQAQPALLLEDFDGVLEPAQALMLEQAENILEKTANEWLDKVLGGDSEMLADFHERKMILANLEARRYIRRLLSGWAKVSLN